MSPLTIRDLTLKLRFGAEPSLALAILSACGGTEPTPPTPTPSALNLAVDRSNVFVLERITATAEVLDAAGHPLPVQVSWSNTGPSEWVSPRVLRPRVATLLPNFPGTGSIIASIGTLSKTVTVSAIARPPSSIDVLTDKDRYHGWGRRLGNRKGILARSGA